LARGDQQRDLDGNYICKKCWKRDARLAKKEHELAELQETLDTKIRAADNVIMVETKKRLELEGRVARRLLKCGEYQLEGLDAKLVPNGVVAHRMEEAESGKKKLAVKLTEVSDKLRDERRQSKLKDRARRKAIAYKTEEVLEAKKLCFDLEKKALRAKRKAESCALQADKAKDAAKEAKSAKDNAIAALARARARRKLHLQQLRRLTGGEGESARSE